MIIFDLGGVLLREAEINLQNVIPAHIPIELIDGKPPRIFNRMFEFVNHIYGKDCKRSWIIGTISGEEIVQNIHAVIESPEHEQFFKSVHERNLIKHGSEYILLPEQLVALTQLQEEGFEFIKRCKQKGIRIVMLSNWDPTSFIVAKEKFKELFALCNEEDIIIPAYAGYIKPEPEIFAYVIKKTGVDASKAFFVDDSAVNVAAGQKHGITSIVHRSWQQTEQELKEKGLLI